MYIVNQKTIAKDNLSLKDHELFWALNLAVYYKYLQGNIYKRMVLLQIVFIK